MSGNKIVTTKPIDAQDSKIIRNNDTHEMHDEIRAKGGVSGAVKSALNQVTPKPRPPQTPPSKQKLSTY